MSPPADKAASSGSRARDSNDAQEPQQGGTQGSGDTISLRVWGAEEDQALLAELVEKFKAAHPDQTFEIQIGVESESTAKDTILTDVTAAADVYAFACDSCPTWFPPAPCWPWTTT